MTGVVEGLGVRAESRADRIGAVGGLGTTFGLAREGQSELPVLGRD